MTLRDRDRLEPGQGLREYPTPKPQGSQQTPTRAPPVAPTSQCRRLHTCERVAPTGGGTLLFPPGSEAVFRYTLHARCLKADSAGGPAPCGRQKRLRPARGFGSSAFSHSLLQAERGSGASRCRSLARRVRYSRQALCNHRSSQWCSPRPTMHTPCMPICTQL